MYLNLVHKQIQIAVDALFGIARHQSISCLINNIFSVFFQYTPWYVGVKIRFDLILQCC